LILAPLALGGLVAVACLGCAHRLVVEPPAAPPPARAAQRIPALLVVERVDSYHGERAVDVSDGFVNRVVMELRRPRAFDAVLPPEAAPRTSRDAVRLRLVFLESFDEHYGPNVAKAIATGLSLMTLAPFVRFDASYRVSIRGRSITCDGWTSDYASDAAGTLSYGFFSNERRARSELGGVVLERALRGALEQVTGDVALAERVADLARNDDCPEREEAR
jgi:hypothetical protein